MSTEKDSWTSIDPSEVYYYDGTPRGDKPYLNAVPYKSFIRDEGFEKVSIPIFAGVTGIIIIICILTRMKRCCFGLFETYRIRPPLKTWRFMRRLNKCFRKISPCCKRRHEKLLYCTCHGAIECMEARFGYQEDRTIQLLSPDEIRQTFNVCKCDILPEPRPAIKRIFVPKDERSVRFNNEVTVVTPSIEYKESFGISETISVPESTLESIDPDLDLP